MDKESATVALALVAILGVFAAVQPLIPSNAERFSELGVLGPNQTIANYPSNVTVNQHFLLYGYIGNHEGVVTYYQLLVKLGTQSTVASNTSSTNAPVIASFEQVLQDNQSWTFPMDLSIGHSGTNLKIIFELWSFNTTSSSFQYTGLWNQLYVNVTR